MKICKTGDTQWTNKHETFVENIKDLYELANESNLEALAGYNDTTKGFQQLINEAIDSKTPLRSFGSGWSWNRIATATGGTMMDTKPLNTIFHISHQSVVASYAGDVDKLFLVQCGNGVAELSEYLRGKNLSLKTSGASNGQTIAGAIGTGAHGSAFDFGAMQDFVVGLHLIIGPNRNIYLERKSVPVVSPHFIQSFETELVQDDDLFHAALVSLGSFGIIHGIMIETEDLYLLETYMNRMPYNDCLKTAIETLDFTKANLPCGDEKPFHFALQVNPYDINNGAYVTTMYKRPYQPNYKSPFTNSAGIGPGDDAACFIGGLSLSIPALVPTIVNKLISDALTPFSKQFGTLAEIFDNTTLHGKLLSSAIGVPISVVNKVIDLFFDFNKTNGPFVGIFGLRFVKKSNAILAFTKFEQTCIFELDAAFSNETYQFYDDFWALLEQHNIPFTFHWGKVNGYNATRINNMYGEAAQEWMVARNKLLDADSIKVFTNPIMQKWGIDKVM